MNLNRFLKMKKKKKKKNEQANKIVDLAEKILDFNNQNKEGPRLKILMPDQMLSRLPISLAPLKAGSNPEKLKNEKIKKRQPLYSLSCSKN